MNARAGLALLCPTMVLTFVGATAHARPIAPEMARMAKSSSCKSTGPCFSQTNKGTGAAIEGVSLESSPGAYGQAAILAHANGIGGIYAFSQSSYGGEFESNGNGYALIAATDSVYGTAFLAENNVNSDGPAILVAGKGGGSAVVLQSPYVGLMVTSQHADAASFSTVDGDVPAIVATNPRAPGAAFAGDGAYGQVVLFDSQGNGTFAGSVVATSFVTDVREGNTQRSAFAAASTRASLEDTGTGRLIDGRGIVRFDAAFAHAIMPSSGYQVFVTPDGQTQGWLYVAQKSAAGFVVREAQSGHSSTAFDYRIVARPAGASDARLPEMEPRRVTRTPKP